MLVLTKPLRNSTVHSSAHCTLPGRSTLSRRVSARASAIRAAITIQVTTTDSATGTPPSTGTVKATLFPSSSTRDSLNASKLTTRITSFSRGLSYYQPGGFGNPFESKKTFEYVRAALSFDSVAEFILY